jgi:Flp pilus assembly protein TadB
VSKHGTLRASDGDRDQIIDRLRKAATEGRIASEELEHRVSAALKARTYDELEETVADLPSSRRQREPARRSVPDWALSTVRANPILLLFAIPVLAVTAAMLLAATIVWAVLIVVVLTLGGRRRALRSPWTYAQRDLRPPSPGRRNHWA